MDMDYVSHDPKATIRRAWPNRHHDRLAYLALKWAIQMAKRARREGDIS